MNLDEPRLMHISDRWIVKYPISETASQNIDVTVDMDRWLYNERERIAHKLINTNPMDVSICDLVHGDQWIDACVMDVFEIVYNP